jgi:hypothetical protein
MDIKHKVQQNQHLSFGINLDYHSVELLYCRFLMPKEIDRELKKNKIIYFIFTKCFFALDGKLFGKA